MDDFRGVIDKNKSASNYKIKPRQLVSIKGPVTFPTIVVLGQKVRSNLVSVVQFFVLIANVASDLPYVAYFGGKSTSKFGLPALFERLAFRL